MVVPNLRDVGKIKIRYVKCPSKLVFSELWLLTDERT